MNVSAEQLKQLRALCEKADATIDDAHEAVARLSSLIGLLQDEESAFQAEKRKEGTTIPKSFFDEIVKPMFQPTRRAL